MEGSLFRTDEELTVIFERQADSIYRLCFLMLKNEQDAMDAVQNTFIRLMGSSVSFENEKHEKAWLLKTASNLCKDHLKHWWYKKTVAIEEDTKESTDSPFHNDVILKILELPEKYKVVIYMHYYEGYSTGEIAEILKKNPSTVRGHLAEGRKFLRLKLEGEE